MRTLVRQASSLSLVIAALAIGGAASASPTAQPRITSVTFTGSQTKPTITIRGQHLGTRPRANPAYEPIGHPPLCPPSPTKPLPAYGFDYGDEPLPRGRDTRARLERRTLPPGAERARLRRRCRRQVHTLTGRLPPRRVLRDGQVCPRTERRVHDRCELGARPRSRALPLTAFPGDRDASSNTMQR